VEIVIEVTNKYTNLAAKIIQESMEKAGNYFVKSVDMSAEPVILKYWDH